MKINNKHTKEHNAIRVTKQYVLLLFMLSPLPQFIFRFFFFVAVFVLGCYLLYFFTIIIYDFICLNRKLNVFLVIVFAPILRFSTGRTLDYWVDLHLRNWRPYKKKTNILYERNIIAAKLICILFIYLNLCSAGSMLAIIFKRNSFSIFFFLLFWISLAFRVHFVFDFFFFFCISVLMVNVIDLN